MSPLTKQSHFIWGILLIVFQFQTNFAQQDVIKTTQHGFFIENKGQWNSEVKYLARIGGMNAWITTQGVVYDFYKIERQYDLALTIHLSKDQKHKYEKENTGISGQVVRMTLIGANANSIDAGIKQKEGYYNYFIGNDQNKWAGRVNLYDNIEQQGIYEGIDLRYYFDQGLLRYDYIAEPGADLEQIRMIFEGQDEIQVNENGEIVLKTALGEITYGKIYAYQDVDGQFEEVGCYFEKKNNGDIGIRVDNYNPNKELIIDPLVYSTFIGGNDWDEGWAFDLDVDGNPIITGFTFSTNFPTTIGAYQTNIAWGDIFVTKLNSNGSELIFSTFLGGNDVDYGYSLSLDSEGAIFLTGATYSSDFPTTAGAYQTIAGGGFGDAFVTKLDALGSSLIYSTYLGSDSEDFGSSLVLKNDGSVFIAGYTSSADFPVTGNAVQLLMAGPSDGFLTRLNSTGSSLKYSTFLGGSSSDGAGVLAIGTDKDIYVVGKTHSSDFPTTPGAFQTVYGGNTDGFITKLTPTGNAILYSTYLGGSGDDTGYGFGVSIDVDGNAFIVGSTNSIDFPVTPSALQTSNNGLYDVFVTKLDALGSSLLYSTFLGGQDIDFGYSIDSDLSGNVFLTGSTNSTDFPITSGAFQTSNNGLYDVYVANLDVTGSILNYSTYLGGGDFDEAYSILQGADGSVTLTGYTVSPDFPVTAGAYQTTFGGIPDDMFVTKMLLTEIPEIIVTFPNQSENLVMGQVYNITWTDNILEDVKIILLKAGVKVRTIISNTPSDGLFSWTVPTDLSAGTDYKVRVVSVTTPSVKDVSDRKFSISTLKAEFALNQNYPNPFNPSTTIKYSIPFEASIKLTVYNVLGEVVSELVNTKQSAGSYQSEFNGSALGSGIYFYRLDVVGIQENKSFTQMNKMLLIK